MAALEGGQFCFYKLSMNYQYESNQLDIKGQLLQFYQITNIDEVFDELISKSADDIEVVDERIPYWTELWPSAIALAEYLVEHDELVVDKHIIEIGCGLGLPSLVAAKLGAKEVIASDYFADSLQFVQKNAELNLISQKILQTASIDWRELDSSPLLKRCETLLVADILYEDRYVVAFKTLLHHLPRGMRIVIAEPGRAVAKAFITELKTNSDFIISHRIVNTTFRSTSFEINLIVISI